MVALEKLFQSCIETGFAYRLIGKTTTIVVQRVQYRVLQTNLKKPVHIKTKLCLPVVALLFSAVLDPHTKG